MSYVWSNDEGAIVTLTKFKLAHISDAHLSPLSHIPQARSVHFHDQIKGKFESLKRLLADEGITHGVISGDLFHLKGISRYYPRDINYYKSLFDELGIHWLVSCGNHDLPGSSFERIEESAYRTITDACDFLHDISGQITTLAYAENPPVPIRMVGVPYYPVGQLPAIMAEFEAVLAKQEPGINIALIHTDALPKNDMPMFWETMSYDELLAMIPSASILCLGHIHQQFPVYAVEGPRFISKPWSFTRVVKDYYVKTECLEHQHRPSVAIITFEFAPKVKVTVEYKEVPHVPFEEAFMRDALKRQIEESVKVRDFMDAIKSQFGSVQNAFQVISPEEFLQSNPIPAEVKAEIDKYLGE